LAGVAALAVLLGEAPVRAANGENAALEWNAKAMAASVAAAQGPLPQMRTLAIVHVTMSDAVHAIVGGVQTYMLHADPPDGASAEAAAIAAAHATLTALFPAQDFDVAFADSLTARGLAMSNPGVAFGQAVAAAVLEVRATDGASAAQFPYSPAGAGTPGVWVPNSPTSAVLPGWGAVRPWVLHSGSQYRPPPPPALESGRYTRDYQEVKDYGGVPPSPKRTDEQSNIAQFWLATPAALFTPLARDVIVARGLGLSDTARVFALIYMAGTDASIACWDAKYTYNYWRPLQAVRNGHTDGNHRTAGDPTWTPFLGNPQHPEYPSGHATASGAFAAALAVLFGDAPGIPLVGRSPTNVGFEREWGAFSEAVDEVVSARIWSGFHFRTADEVGARLGRQVAQFVVQHALRIQHGTDRAWGRTD
jgi:hypothetical protein